MIHVFCFQGSVAYIITIILQTVIVIPVAVTLKFILELWVGIRLTAFSFRDSLYASSRVLH